LTQNGYYDEPEILSYAIPLICSIGADVKHGFTLTQRENSVFKRDFRFLKVEIVTACESVFYSVAADFYKIKTTQH
jgi:hypothetical protein